jgi:hypothetical protein
MSWIKKRYVDQIRCGMLMLLWVMVIVCDMCGRHEHVWLSLTCVGLMHTLTWRPSVRESLFMVVFK